MENPSKILFSLLIIAATFCSFIKDGIDKDVAPTKQKQGVRKIVIDPGHGGADYGASGKYSHEKDIALAVALKLEAEIKKQMKLLQIFRKLTATLFCKKPILD